MQMTITIMGQTRPARFSLRAAINIADRYGGVMKALFDEEIGEAERMKRRIAVLRECLLAGKAWSEQENGEKTSEIPDEESLIDKLTMAELGRVFPQMLAVINEDQHSEFGAEAPDGKNQEATQVQ